MIIATYITATERHRLTQRDQEYFRRKLNTRCLLNEMMHRLVNKKLLAELLCLLERRPMPRRSAGQSVRGQISRLSDGSRHPVTTSRVSPEEMDKLWR